MTIDIEKWRADIRADTRRFAVKMVAGLIAAFAAGGGTVLLAAYLGGKLQ